MENFLLLHASDFSTNIPGIQSMRNVLFVQAIDYYYARVRGTTFPPKGALSFYRENGTRPGGINRDSADI